MKKTRLVSLMLAAAMAGSLTGCGGGGAADGGSTEATTQAQAGGASTEATTAAETVEAAEGQTVLKWSIWDKDLTI